MHASRDRQRTPAAWHAVRADPLEQGQRDRRAGRFAGGSDHRSVLRPAREQGDAGIDYALRERVPGLCTVAQAARAPRAWWDRRRPRNRGVWCPARFRGAAIETCLFIGPAREPGDWNVVKGLFAADTLGTDQRRMLLSGKSADGLANAGPIVCAWFGVGRNTICDTIAGGARSTADIGAKLKAGTNCGSCLPELKRLIAQTATGEPAQRKLAA